MEFVLYEERTEILNIFFVYVYFKTDMLEYISLFDGKRNWLYWPYVSYLISANQKLIRSKLQNVRII